MNVHCIMFFFSNQSPVTGPRLCQLDALNSHNNKPCAVVVVRGDDDEDEDEDEDTSSTDDDCSNCRLQRVNCRLEIFFDEQRFDM